MNIESTNTLVIGAGQAGLSVGYHLKKQNIPYLILDANTRIGDSWRQRWDSLRLFTPARFNALDGMRFPAPPHYSPTKDEMADFLEEYARRFELLIQTGVKVERLARENGHFVAFSKSVRYVAENVVIAMASYQSPRIPPFAGELDPGIVQLHSLHYRNPSQLKDGPVLLVGAGNSGAEIAMEVATTHKTWMAGRSVGHLPFRIEGLLSRLILGRIVLRFLFHHILTVSTPIGRNLRPMILSKGGPLIRQKPVDLRAAGIESVPRVAGARNGKPVLEDGRMLDAANVIWCTGFDPGFSWIDLPISANHEPRHRRGIVENQPGLYFVGLHFLYSMSSSMIHGVGRDARYIAKHIRARVNVKGK